MPTGPVIVLLVTGVFVVSIIAAPRRGWIAKRGWVSKQRASCDPVWADERGQHVH